MLNSDLKRWVLSYGQNIEDNDLSLYEHTLMLDSNFARCQKELAPFPWYVNQPENVQAALMSMCINLGIEKLLGFRKMIMALTVKDYTRAAIESLNSKWAEKIGSRAQDVALMIRQG